jgi:hypothetical protein
MSPYPLPRDARNNVRIPQSEKHSNRPVESANGIFPGPDTDPLDLPYRYDGCHFTDEGLDKVSGLWVEAFIETKVVFHSD